MSKRRRVDHVICHDLMFPLRDLTNGVLCASPLKVEGESKAELGLALQHPRLRDRPHRPQPDSPAASPVLRQPFFAFPLQRRLRCRLLALIYHHDLQPLNMVGPRKRGADAEEEELVALPSDEEDDEEEEE